MNQFRELGEGYYVAHSATLRIRGHNLPIDQISEQLGLLPTHMHLKGDIRTYSEAPFLDDAWHYQASADEEQSMSVHLEELCSAILPNAAYVKNLKAIATVDIYCSYRSNIDYAGFEVSHESLRIFQELSVPFSVAVIVIPDN